MPRHAEQSRRRDGAPAPQYGEDLDKLYMQKQVDLAGLPAPRAIGIDEISIRKGHNYRVIVSDLDRERPIWSVVKAERG